MGWPAGRTRMARNQLAMAASGLSVLALVPCRQVTGLGLGRVREGELAQGHRRAR